MASYLRLAGAHVETVTEDAMARDLGVDYLHRAVVLTVTMSDTGGRWRAFRQLEAWNPWTEARHKGGPLIDAQVVLWDDDTGVGADTHPIFPTEVGTPMDDHNYRRRVFKPAAKRAGVPWATPHKLRHGMASLMAERGYGAADIASLLGHADGGVLALRTYIHPKVRAVDFVDDVLAGTCG